MTHWAKTKFAATISLAATIIVGAIWITPINSAQARQPPNAMPPDPGDEARLKAQEDLATIYSLPDEENLRRIKPPFPKERAAYINFVYSYAGGSSNVHSLGFAWSDGKLMPRYMLYPDPTATNLVETELSIPWYNLDHLDRINWKPGKSDWVIRDGLSIDNRLAALAKLISQDTNKKVTFESKKTTRPCIVLKGKCRPAPSDAEKFNVVVVTLETLPLDELQQWVDGKALRKKVDKYPQFQFKSTSQILDAPFFDNRKNKDPFGYQQDIGSKFYTGADAHLDRTRPGYQDQLQKVLDNIESQIGGDWSIEEREIETWEPKVE